MSLPDKVSLVSRTRQEETTGRVSAAGTRIDVIDAVRGFALMGVVISNVAVVWGSGSGLAPESPADRWVGEVQAYLLTGRFLSLFSLLFGLSFGLYLDKSLARPEFDVPRYLRRLGLLFLLGILNRVLFGLDILMAYAVLGAVMLLFRNASDRALVIAAVMAMGAPTLWELTAGLIGYEPPAPPVSSAERLRLAVDGEYLALLQIRAAMLTGWWRQLLRTDAAYLPLFFAGLLIARRHMRAGKRVQQRQLRKAFLVGLVVTALGFMAQSVLKTQLSLESPWRTHSFGIVWHLTIFAQAATYGAGLGLLWRLLESKRNPLIVLAPAGRMALTNYIAASLVTTVIVVISGSYGRVGVAAASLAGLALWLVQLAASHCWLRRYPLGPLEWVWRRLADGAESIRHGGLRSTS